MRSLKLTLLSLCVWLGAASAAGTDSNDPAGREFQLKTAYLFHFAELTQWPNPGSVTICLQGRSPLREILPVLEGQPINGTRLHVDLSDNPDLSHCNILMVGEPLSLTSELSEQVQKFHLLTVGDAEGFAEHGGMVQFTLRDNKLKLVVNLAAVKAANLKLSSKLLRMAEIIE